MKTKLTLYALFLAILGAATLAKAQSTAFTYQGRLNLDGAPVNGAYDFRFSIYTAGAGGSLVAGPLPLDAVDVVHGLFVTRLDFGVGVFTGPARWLEVSVRPAGNGNFRTLDQRLELTSSPYSIRAQAAGVADSIAAGSVVKSLNGLKDDLVLAKGNNIDITPSGNTLTISATATAGSVWSLNGLNAYYSAGNVGIGTSTPQTTLDIVAVQHALTMTASGPDVTFKDTANGNARGVIQSVKGELNLFAESYMSGANPLALLTLKNTGNVGIGNPQPQHSLDIFSPQHALAMTANGPDLTFYDNAHGYARDVIQSVNGDLNFFTETYMRGDNPSAFLKLAYNGNVGIGTPTPISRLEVVGQDALGLVGPQPFLTFRDTAAGYAQSRVAGGFGHVTLQTQSYINSSDPNSGFLIVRSDTARVGVNTANPQTTLDVNGTTRTKVLTITGGADLAEPFAMSQEGVSPGSVVVIDEKSPGSLRLSTQAYDRRVAGVVSGANGIKPGIRLYQESAIEGGENVALSGRVYVQADAAFGTIEPGDLLTTSDTPGHAMKVIDHAKGQGAILGKAISGLKEGKGLVLVLVTLQ